MDRKAREPAHEPDRRDDPRFRPVDACLDTSGPLVLRGLGRWLVNDLADDVLSEQDRISLVITVRTMKEETEKWQSAS